MEEIIDNKKVVSYYTGFLSSLSNKNDPVKSSLDGFSIKKRKNIYPKVLTKKKASEKGVWWFLDLLDVFYIAERQGIVKDIIVHGSYGDFSNTNFSDIEATIIIDDSVVFDIDKRVRLSSWISNHFNKFIVRVDPTQHHGVFFLWKNLIDNYSELILPFSAYESCWSINGIALNFCSTDDLSVVKKESLFRLESTLKKLANPKKYFFSYGFSDYSVKRYLSNLLLVPAFYYQSEGYLLNKKDAINRFKMEFPGFLIKSLSCATDIRNSWPRQSEVLRLLRPFLIRGSIPQGRLDLMLLALLSPRHRKFKENYLPFMISESGKLLRFFFENNK